MGGTGTVPDADRGWLAKVLAGDRLMCGVLELAHSLPADEWDAFVRCVRRVKTGSAGGVDGRAVVVVSTLTGNGSH